MIEVNDPVVVDANYLANADVFLLEDQANNYSPIDLDPFFSDIDEINGANLQTLSYNVESYCTDTEDNESLFLITPNIQNSTELHFEVASNYYGECEITILLQMMELVN